MALPTAPFNAAKSIYAGKKVIQVVLSTGSVTGATAAGSSATISAAAHGFSIGDMVQFISGTGFTGLTAGTNYFVVAAATGTFEVSATAGGTAITITAEGKVVVNGDYSNKSKYIRVETTEGVTNGGVSPQLVPFGFRALKSPIPAPFTQPPAATIKANQLTGGSYNRRVYYGFDYTFATNDNFSYLRPIPTLSTTGSNVDFYLGNYEQNAAANFPTAGNGYSSSIDLTSNTALDTRKFMVPFQGGFDGHKPHLQKKTGTYIDATNTQGFDISTS